MVEVDDVHDFATDLLRAQSRLEKANISDTNKQMIKRFVMSLRRDGLKKATLLNYINFGTRMCQRFVELGIDKPLNEINQDDFDDFLMYMEDEKGIKPGGIKLYKIFFKKFSKWALDDQPKWIREMKFPKVNSRVQPSDLPDASEFEAIMNSVKYPRDKALLAVMADGGFRVGGILSCKIKSVEFGKYGAVVYLNPEGSNKTTMAKGIPLTWSTGYLNQWMAIHPYREDPEAPLFVELHFNLETKKYDAWSYAAAYQMIKRLQKRLGTKKDLHPHLFKHKAVTDWILDGLTEQQINHRAGWSPASKQMIITYGNFTDQEMNDGVWEHYGLKTEDKRKITLKTCPRCNNILREEDRFCSQCSLVLDQAALREMQAYEDDFRKVYTLLRKMKEEEGM
jgi:integrase